MSLRLPVQSAASTFFMTDPQDPTPTEPCCNWQGFAADFRQRAETLVRDEPAKAIGIAALAGLLLTILPIGYLLRSLVRLALALAKPALFIFGAMKLYENFDKKQDS